MLMCTKNKNRGTVMVLGHQFYHQAQPEIEVCTRLWCPGLISYCYIVQCSAVTTNIMLHIAFI